MIAKLSEALCQFAHSLLVVPVVWLLKALGIHVLSRPQMIRFLQPYQLWVHPADRIQLPSVVNSANEDKLIFQQRDVVTDLTYVWYYQPAGALPMQLPLGGIWTDQHVLYTDLGKSSLLTDLIFLKKRPIRFVSTLLAPCSHELDGHRFGGYTNFMLLVAAKLCRMKKSLPEAIFSQSTVSYPLFDTSYEREMMQLLGLDQNQLIDSRYTKVTAQRCILGTSGPSFYPNVADLLALKNQVENVLKPRRTLPRPIYISRSGRGRIVNEPELIRLLKRYDFYIIEDQPRSIAEQVSIYKNASFILGSHGDSFTNILWCESGTHL